MSRQGKGAILVGYNRTKKEKVFMALSGRARRMLKQGTRSPADSMDHSSIVAALEKANLPVYEAIVAFQQEFGGITYRVRGDSGGMSWGLFQPTVSGFTPDGSRYYFECGTFRVAAPV